MSETDDNADRRDYFRLEDKVHLIRQPLEKHMLSEDPYHERYHIPRQTVLMSQLRALEGDYRATMRQLSNAHPALHAVLDTMDRKLDLLAKYITNDGLDDSTIVREWVELSERGISFRSTSAIERGSLLHLTLVLFPTGTTIAAIGEVRSSVLIETGPAIFRVGVEFKVLLESDRKQLSRHLLRKQARLRRTGRE